MRNGFVTCANAMTRSNSFMTEKSFPMVRRNMVTMWLSSLIVIILVEWIRIVTEEY